MKLGTAIIPKVRIVGFLTIFLLVFISRYATRGEVYFVDGPRLVTAILNHTYVIQAPGYWLFARTAGLFPNPAFGLAFVNECCSAFGASFLFLVSLDLGLSPLLAGLTALAASSVFFVWFAGDVHSSYATQLFFPVLAVWFLIQYHRCGALWTVIAAAASLAVGTGMRPSDGAFLVPFFAMSVFRLSRSRRHLVWFAATFAALCLAWYVPTKLASSHANQTVAGQMVPVAEGSSILFGATPLNAVVNAMRLALPLLVAFWMLIPAWMTSRHKSLTRPILMWILPGLAFFLLVQIANPAYLVYAVPAWVMLAALSDRRRLAIASLLVCILWNSGFFLWARPIRSQRKVAIAVDYYAVMYTNYALQHTWMHRVSDNEPIP
jgi:hypothetical protein